MKTQYVAIDGKIFYDYKECQKYEQNVKTFSIEYIDTNCAKKTYTGNGKDFDLDSFVNCAYAFRITNGYNNWNDFIDTEFAGLDDSVYYSYNSPRIEEEDINEWLGYTSGGEVELFEDIIQDEENYLQRLKKIQKML